MGYGHSQQVRQHAVTWAPLIAESGGGASCESCVTVWHPCCPCYCSCAALTPACCRIITHGHLPGGLARLLAQQDTAGREGSRGAVVDQQCAAGGEEGAAEGPCGPARRRREQEHMRSATAGLRQPPPGGVEQRASHTGQPTIRVVGAASHATVHSGLSATQYGGPAGTSPDVSSCSAPLTRPKLSVRRRHIQISLPFSTRPRPPPRPGWQRWQILPAAHPHLISLPLNRVRSRA